MWTQTAQAEPLKGTKAPTGTQAELQSVNTVRVESRAPYYSQVHQFIPAVFYNYVHYYVLKTIPFEESQVNWNEILHAKAEDSISSAAVILTWLQLRTVLPLH